MEKNDEDATVMYRVWGTNRRARQNEASSQTKVANYCPPFSHQHTSDCLFEASGGGRGGS